MIGWGPSRRLETTGRLPRGRPVPAWRRVISLCLDSQSTAARILATGKMRIGFNPMRPWCYRMGGELAGQDISACLALARLTGTTPVFVQCPSSEIMGRLAAGELDVGVGGLVEQCYEEIRCVRAAQLQPVEGFDRRRQIFFPTVWWIRRDQTAWFVVLWMFLAWRRIRGRLGAA